MHALAHQRPSLHTQPRAAVQSISTKAAVQGSNTRAAVQRNSTKAAALRDTNFVCGCSASTLVYNSLSLHPRSTHISQVRPRRLKSSTAVAVLRNYTSTAASRPLIFRRHRQVCYAVTAEPERERDVVATLGEEEARADIDLLLDTLHSTDCFTSDKGCPFELENMVDRLVADLIASESNVVRRLGTNGSSSLPPMYGDYRLLYVSSRRENTQRMQRMLRNRILQQALRYVPLDRTMEKFTSSKLFQDFVQRSYADADLDGDGKLGIAEFYTCLLLVYSKINMWLPISAMTPSRNDVLTIFQHYDKDGSGYLSYDEFNRIIKCILLADRTNASDSFLYRWVSSFGVRLLLQPAEALIQFLPTQDVDSALLTAQPSFGQRLSDFIFHRRGVYQRVVRPGIFIMKCDFRVLGCLPGVVWVRARARPHPDGPPNAVQLKMGAPRMMLPGSLQVAIGDRTDATITTEYVDDRIKILRGSHGSLFVFESVPPSCSHVSDMKLVAKRRIEPLGYALVSSLLTLLGMSSYTLWQHGNLWLLAFAWVGWSTMMIVLEGVVLKAVVYEREATDTNI